MNRKRSMVYYLVIFAYFGWISYNIPLTGDDWMWGSNSGTDLLKNGYRDYNGRYASNTIEIILTRITWVRVLFMAVFSTLLIICSAKLTERIDKKIPLLAAFFLFMLVPTKIFSQTYGWVAGYVNYIPSVVLLIIYLLVIKNIVDDKPPVYKKKLVFWMIPLGIVTQLIVEHVTLFSIFTGFLVIVYSYVKFKKFYSVHWVYFISSIVGGIIMFSNNAYLKIITGNDPFREVKEYNGILDRFYTSYKEGMYQYLFTENVLIQLTISVLLVVLVLRSKANKRWIENVLKPFFLFVIVSFDLFILIFKNVLGNQYLGMHTSDFEALFTLVYFITMVASILLFVQQKASNIRLIYYVFGIVLLTIPFVFISPFGPRCVFGAYTFMVLFILELLVYLGNQYEWSFQSLKSILITANIVLMIVFTFILSLNGYTDRNRIHKLNNDLNKKIKIVEMSELPYPQFHWKPSPVTGMKQNFRFKVFYHVPEKVEIKVIPYFQSQR